MPRPLPIPARRSGEPPAGYVRWSEAVRTSGLASPRLERLVRRGVIPAQRLGAQVWVDGAAIARYLGASRLPEAAPELPAPLSLPEDGLPDRPVRIVANYPEKLAIRAVVAEHERALREAQRQARIAAGLRHQLEQTEFRQQKAEQDAIVTGPSVVRFAETYGVGLVRAIRQELRVGAAAPQAALTAPTAPIAVDAPPGEAGDLRDCACCGTSFVLTPGPGGGWKRRRFCTPYCRKRAFDERRRGRTR